jgi:hypothetical protein
VHQQGQRVHRREGAQGLIRCRRDINRRAQG